MNNDKVVKIDLSDIRIGERLREVDSTLVESLKRDFPVRGMRQPIEVVKRKNGNQHYELIDGAHRLTAAQELDWPEIAAFVRKAKDEPRKEGEILANLIRRDLTVSDRAVFVCELKEVWDQSGRFAGEGGDRRSEKFHSANVAEWSEVMAEETGWPVRTLRRSYRIGQILTPNMREFLRGSDMLNNQKQLEDLAGLCLSEDLRTDIARLVVDGKAKTVKAAHLIASGGMGMPEEISKQDAELKKLQTAWGNASKVTRRIFWAEIEDFE